MKISATQTGFALYKEADIIGPVSYTHLRAHET